MSKVEVYLNKEEIWQALYEFTEKKYGSKALGGSIFVDRRRDLVTHAKVKIDLPEQK